MSVLFFIVAVLVSLGAIQLWGPVKVQWPTYGLWVFGGIWAVVEWILVILVIATLP